MTATGNPELSLNDRRWLELRLRLNQENIKNAVLHLRSHGIEPILIKGWAAARYYPEPFRRVCSDVDIAVAAEHYDDAAAALDGQKERSWGVDLHRGLRHLDTVEWDKLVENSILIDVHGVAIRVLSAEDHVRVLAVHWLTDGGGYREKLDDIVHLIDREREGFDWNRCLDSVPDVRRGWILKTIGLASVYGGLKIDGLPFGDEIRDIPRWLTNALEREWKSGVRLKPLHILLGDRRQLWQQIKKRIPPNPIQASIDTNAPFDDSSRARFQIESLWLRIKPSAARVVRAFFKGKPKLNG